MQAQEFSGSMLTFAAGSACFCCSWSLSNFAGAFEAGGGIARKACIVSILALRAMPKWCAITDWRLQERQSAAFSDSDRTEVTAMGCMGPHAHWLLVARLKKYGTCLQRQASQAYRLQVCQA